METKDGHIVILLSNKGYVAFENNQIFQLWKRQRLGDIYNELHFRYPSFKISLGSLEQIDFKDVVNVCNQFINEDMQPEFEDNKSNPITNFNKDLVTGTKTMKTRNKAKVKAVAVIGINITAGVMHLGFQSMADIVCYSEAKIIDKLNVFDKTVEEIMNARKANTKESQQSILKSPKKVRQSTNKFYCRIKEIKERAINENTELIKTAQS